MDITAATLAPSSFIADPSAGLDLLEAWLFYGGPHGRQFTERANISEPAEAIALYESCVAAAVLVVDTAQGIGSFQLHAETFAEIVALARTEGLHLPWLRQVRPDTRDGMAVLQFVSSVFDALESIAERTKTDSSFQLPADRTQRRRTFALACAVMETLVEEHRLMHRLATTAEAFVEYRLRVADAQQ